MRSGFACDDAGKASGFTLAELLIALAILGLIATFTIPKVLSSQQDNRFRAVTKEAAAMISGAYEAYKQDNTVVATTGPTHLTPYMNYVAVRTTGTIDNLQTLTTDTCSNGNPCIMLHNGGGFWL